MSDSGGDWKERWQTFQTHLDDAFDSKGRPDSVCQFMARTAAPLLRRFDNPFFALEIRLLDRVHATKTNSFAVESGTLLAIARAVYYLGMEKLDRRRLLPAKSDNT